MDVILDVKEYLMKEIKTGEVVCPKDFTAGSRLILELENASINCFWKSGEA